jgi:phage/plasmid-associated DNA primase
MQFAKHLTAWRDLASFEQQPVSKDAWREKSGIRPATFPDLRAVLLGHGCISENADGTYTTVTEPTREMYGWVDQEKAKAKRKSEQEDERKRRKDEKAAHKAEEDAAKARAAEEKAAQRVEPLLKHGSDAEIAALIAGLQLKGAVWDEGKFWQYNGKVWAEIQQHELKNLIGKYDGEPYGYWGDSIVMLNAGRIASIISILQAKLTKPDFFANAAIGFNCEAGFIAFAEDGKPTLQPHSKDHRQRHPMRGTWTPGTNADQIVRDCLQTNFKGDEDAEAKIDALGEATGAAMLGKAVHKGAKALWLYGDTADNGKSTVIEFISAGVPSTAGVSVPPHKLGDPQFAITTAGKYLNAVGELDASAIPTTVFKSMITGDKITAKEVYKPACTFTPTAQHIYGCNRLPAFQGGMGWDIRKRILPISFNRTIPEEERNELLERIPIDHPDAFLAFAVKGAMRWLKQGKHFTIPTSSAELLESWSLDADPVLDWVEQRVAPVLQVVGEKPTEMSNVLCFRDFLLWAGAEGLDPRDLPRQKGFTDRVKTALRRKGIYYKKSGGFRGFVGLRLYPPTAAILAEAQRTNQYEVLKALYPAAIREAEDRMQAEIEAVRDNHTTTLH